MTALWDEPTTPTVPLHACAGSVCQVCAGSRNGNDAKDRGTKAVNRDPEWVHRAEEWLEVQHAGANFTADDVVCDLGKPQGSPNQIGALLRAWAARGHIRPVGFAEAYRKESHGRVLRIWEVIA